MPHIAIGADKSGAPIKIEVDTLLATRLLIQANSGGGKSYAIRRLAEQAFGKVQQIIIDPEGEFATLREKHGFVLVGPGGETPADPRSAALVAEKLLELHASAICDIYELKAAQRHTWVRAFLDAMINAPEKGQGESEAAGAMIDLATRGRKRGFCAVFATQRLGKLSKNASAELQNRLIGPTFEDIDRKRAADLLGVLRQDERDFFRQIQLLEPGNFFALGRAIALERVLFRVGSIETSHPQPGKKLVAPPPAPASIAALLPKLEDIPKAAEERARTEQELRAEIGRLKRELQNKPPQIDVAAEVDSAVKSAIAAQGTVYHNQFEFFSDFSSCSSMATWRTIVTAQVNMATNTKVHQNTYFGPLLRSLRQAARMSPATFARQLGISHPYLFRVETGLQRPLTDAMIRRAAEILGTDPLPLLLAAATQKGEITIQTSDQSSAATRLLCLIAHCGPIPERTARRLIEVLDAA